MGTFKDSLKKWFYTQGTQASSTSARIPLLDASGNPIGSDTPNNIFKQQPLFTGNVGVATRESDGNPRFRQPDQAALYISTAVGVWVQEGGKLLIVAKDQAQNTKWATSLASGGTTGKGREAAIADMAGRTNTNTIISTLGSNAPAAKYCREYFPKNVTSSDSTFGAGRWWLPSCGELWMIWSHLLEINRIMSVIGGTELNRGHSYWSSTENSKSLAWAGSFNDGKFDGTSKTLTNSVRAVSALY